ncbi:MAG TPA: IS3 family transposase, partial [Gemmatimonadaceae bacterium]|nr:IS3 family transposase [Gemmatimonadaceae bacterium]
MKFAFIARQRLNRPSETVRLMCKWLEVSRSGFYAAIRRSPSQRSLSRQKLKLQIRAVYSMSRRRYGAPRVHAELKAHGETCGHNQVARLMREEGLKGKKARRFKVTTMSSHNKAVAPNVLARSFNISNRKMNSAWAGDITYLPTREGWLYLATLIDLSSRRVVGWSLASNLEESLTLRALKMALATREIRSAAEMLHHSDRGSQYASTEYQSTLSSHCITPSMSRKGDCWDNAVAESFFATLKAELVAD